MEAEIDADHGAWIRRQRNRALSYGLLDHKRHMPVTTSVLLERRAFDRACELRFGVSDSNTSDLRHPEHVRPRNALEFYVLRETEGGIPVASPTALRKVCAPCKESFEGELEVPQALLEHLAVQSSQPCGFRPVFE